MLTKVKRWQRLRRLRKIRQNRDFFVWRMRTRYNAYYPQMTTNKFRWDCYRKGFVPYA